MPRIRCKHCSRERDTTRSVGRGLCRVCYDDKSIRHLYPMLRVVLANHVGVQGGGHVVRPGASLVPCPWVAGTVEKMAVLAQRAADGLPLWHPRDGYGMCGTPLSVDEVYERQRRERVVEFRRVLDECGWRTPEVARRLGLNEKTVCRRIQKYGLREGQHA